MGSFFTVTRGGFELRSRLDDTNAALVTVGKGSLTGSISGVEVTSTFNLFFTTGSPAAGAPLLGEVVGLGCDGDLFFVCMAWSGSFARLGERVDTATGTGCSLHIANCINHFLENSKLLLLHLLPQSRQLCIQLPTLHLLNLLLQ